MHKLGAAVGAIIFFLLAPGVVAGLIPWWLTGWRVLQPSPSWGLFRWVGIALVAACVLALISAFGRFVLEGAGTPAPIAPTERLVIGGLYRHVRNPMYLAVVCAIAGQAVALGQLVLLLYAAAVAVATASFARWYEEPTLLKRFGADYDAYRRAVPGWWPRLRPWRGSTGRR